MLSLNWSRLPERPGLRIRSGSPEARRVDKEQGGPPWPLPKELCPAWSAWKDQAYRPEAWTAQM